MIIIFQYLHIFFYREVTVFTYSIVANFWKKILMIKSDFYYSPCNTPKRVTSWRGPLRVIAPEQHSSFRRKVAAVASRWQPCV